MVGNINQYPGLKRIVLVRRGGCTFVQKAQNAVAKGAKYMLIYNNAPGTGAFDVRTVPSILAAGMVLAVYTLTDWNAKPSA